MEMEKIHKIAIAACVLGIIITCLAVGTQELLDIEVTSKGTVEYIYSNEGIAVFGLILSIVGGIVAHKTKEK